MIINHKGGIMAYYKYNPGQLKEEVDKYQNVFEEFDFGYIEQGCDFFCPECRDIMKCEAFSEVKEAWELFYM